MHLDFMPVTCKAVSTIDSVKPLSHSNYVMTCSNSSVNIWSTKIGLYLAAGYNFKKQAKQVDGSKTTCSLYWQQFAKVVDKDGVTINLGGKCAVPVTCGDVFVLKTPGGGGWGNYDSPLK